MRKYKNEEEFNREFDKLPAHVQRILAITHSDNFELEYKFDALCALVMQLCTEVNKLTGGRNDIH